jgi:hypothetical protein
MSGSRRHISGVVVAVLAVATGSPLFAAKLRPGEFCTGSDQCPVFAVCSTELGVCGNGAKPLLVCTGSCADPKTWHFVARAGFVGLWDGGAKPGLGLSLELAPPVLRNRLSVAADLWSERLLRFGAAVSLPASDDFLVGVRLDATTLTATWAWGASVAARSEILFELGTTMGLSFEVGALAPSAARLDHVWPFAIVNLGFWVWRPELNRRRRGQQ